MHQNITNAQTIANGIIVFIVSMKSNMGCLTRDYYAPGC